MPQFDYLKTSIKQKGCTLQQVADASGMTKGYLSQLLNDKIKARARKSSRRCTVFSGWSSRVKRLKSAWCLVNFTRCTPATST